MRFDPSSPPSVLESFVRVSTSTDPDATDSLLAFRGVVYGSVPGHAVRPLLRMDGYRIARAVRIDAGYDVLAREVAVFCDLATGARVDRFHNPYTGRCDDVLHGWSDPANESFGEGDVTVEVFGDAVHFTTDRVLDEPSPLPRAKWALESPGRSLVRTALSRFATTGADLDADGPSVQAQFSSVRQEPWLPWMRMGDRPGTLLTHLGGAKLAGGYAALPAFIRTHVEENRPEFAFAPRTFAAPNESSWSIYAKERRPSIVE